MPEGQSLAGAGMALRFEPDGSYLGFQPPVDHHWVHLLADAVAARSRWAPCPPSPTVPRELAGALTRRRSSHLGGPVASLPALDDARRWRTT